MFQHPSPATGDRDSLAMAGKHCIVCFLQGIIDSIYFVYDVNHRKESVCWNYEELKECFFSKLRLTKKELDGINVSKDFIVSNFDDDTMDHPLFDLAMRKGWAALKKGEEHSFSICHV